MKKNKLLTEVSKMLFIMTVMENYMLACLREYEKMANIN